MTTSVNYPEISNFNSLRIKYHFRSEKEIEFYEFLGIDERKENHTITEDLRLLEDTTYEE
ncbi:hypothetical protein [Paenibacillus tyrfis]|uniref:hypothetical protein n=1 Tax=Paenibacillus tyrfis TaxID=1501230 RepID=UPI00209EC1A3|nr:hypothetical protein [Paenibacillus tyrfis]MCP1312406.1 hypothetical protein [Paenibacillus tyrfis]